MAEAKEGKGKIMQKSKRLEIMALVVGLLLIGVGLAAWLSQYWTFDFDFEIGDSKTAVAKHESAKLAVVGCRSNDDCDLGLECFRRECSYPCRGALMCPVGMACGVAKYCEYEPEVCGDGIDNDQDGRIDEGCACVPASTITCSTGFAGICSMGETTCLFDGSGYGACMPVVIPSAEICGDRIDNNCDGRIDEGCGAPHRVEILYRAPRGAAGVDLYSNFTGLWDNSQRSESGDLTFHGNLFKGTYIFNLNFRGVAPYWACSGNPTCGKSTSMAGDLEVEVDGRPVRVELEDNHMCGCNLEISI